MAFYNLSNQAESSLAFDIRGTTPVILEKYVDVVPANTIQCALVSGLIIEGRFEAQTDGDYQDLETGMSCAAALLTPERIRIRITQSPGVTVPTDVLVELVILS